VRRHHVVTSRGIPVGQDLRVLPDPSGAGASPPASFQ
jgi:hypothetical protein